MQNEKKKRKENYENGAEEEEERETERKSFKFFTQTNVKNDLIDIIIIFDIVSCFPHLSSRNDSNFGNIFFSFFHLISVTFKH